MSNVANNDNKKRLSMFQKNEIPKRSINTCFSTVEKYEAQCKRENCQQWINNPESGNCLILATRKGPHTLQHVGKIYGLTRMRICQIEKNIMKKIKKSII